MQEEQDLFLAVSSPSTFHGAVRTAPCAVFLHARCSNISGIFWINLPVSGTSFLLLFFFLDIHNPRTSLKDGLKAIDWYGSATLLGVMLMLLLGLDFGGAIFPWKSPTVICLIVISGLMIPFFIFVEEKFAKHPLIPLGIFKGRSNIASLLLGFCHDFVSSHPFSVGWTEKN